MGNTRVTFTDSANVARSLSENHYYPFGMAFSGIPQKQTGNLYLYNGKELQNDFGLDWYDYGARFYDGAVGKWWSIDPLAEKSSRWSPYNYCENNPIRFIDPDGMEIDGETKQDAQNFRNDIYKILANKKFDNVRALITVSGRIFQKIDSKALSNALDGLTLSKDETAYINLITNTINSKEIQTVEYLNYSDNASSDGANAVKGYFQSKGIPAPLTSDGDLKAATISVFGGAGFNVPTNNGSHSFIISGAPNRNGTDQAVTSGHEVMGHGIPSSRNMSATDNNSNAIRTDNLIRRMLNLPQRDGSDHAGFQQGMIVNPYDLPFTK